jgi:hypothetical protein
MWPQIDKCREGLIAFVAGDSMFKRTLYEGKRDLDGAKSVIYCNANFVMARIIQHRDPWMLRKVWRLWFGNCFLKDFSCFLKIFLACDLSVVQRPHME